MYKKNLKRIIFSLITIIAVITVTFFLVNLIPGGPFNTLNENMPEEAKFALEEKYGLNRPIIIQYFNYLSGLLKLDFGPSLKRLGTPVSVILKQALPVSAFLGFLAIIFITFISFSIGFISALAKNRFVKISTSFLTTLGMSIPSIVIAPSVLYIFSGVFNWLPSTGLETWKHYLLPIIALSIFPSSFLTRLIYTSVNDVLDQSFIKNLEGNNLPKFRIIFFHIFPNIIPSVLSYYGPMIASLLTGSFIVEKVFTIPGMGKYFVESITDRDYPLILGTTIVYCTLIILVILINDTIIDIIDPRVRDGIEDNSNEA